MNAPHDLKLSTANVGAASLPVLESHNEPLNRYLKSLPFRDVLVMCCCFERYHHRWPHVTDSAATFVEAGIKSAEDCGIDGKALDAVVCHGNPAWEADRDFLEIKQRALLDGVTAINLAMLDPEYRFSMDDKMVGRILDSVQIRLIAPRESNTRWLDNDQVYLKISAEIQDKINAAVGVDRLDFVTHSVTALLYVPAESELAEYIGRLGMVYGNHCSTLGEHYLMDLISNQSGEIYLSLKYQKINGNRRVAEVSPVAVQRFVDTAAIRLRSALEASADPLCRQMLAGTNQSQATIGGTALDADLAKLVVTAQGIALPKEQLKQYPAIKKLIENAGGIYVQNKKYFAFEQGVDPGAVLAKLLDGQKVSVKQETQFFATPKAEAIAICQAAGPLAGKRVLEPSAGDGAIADEARAMGACEVVTIENYHPNVLKLQAKGYTPIAADFLSLDPEALGQFDAIVANPPFTKGQDIDHVMHMLKFLKPGGSMSVIMSTGWLSSENSKPTAFKRLLAEHQIEPVVIPAGTFKGSGTTVETVRLDFNDYQPHLTKGAVSAPVQVRRLRKGAF